MNQNRAEKARLLRAEGKSYRAIAKELGCSHSMAYICVNPEKISRVKCPKCNGEMLANSKTCYSCRQVWNEETVIEAIQDFVYTNGRLPLAEEWQKQSDLTRPSYKSIMNVFGRWNKAIEAAGFVPRTSSRYAHND